MRRIRFVIPGKPAGKGRPRFYGGHAVTPENTREYEKMTAMLFRASARGEKFTDKVPIRVSIEACYRIPAKATKAQKDGRITEAQINEACRRVLDLKEKIASGELMPCIKPDADNIAKIILDSLNKVAWDDDAQVTELTIQKHYSAEPCVIVEISEIIKE